jgi:hypothetical protein
MACGMKIDIHSWLDNVLQASRQEFVVLESHIPPKMHDAEGEADKWSAKDVFAHLTYWLEVFARNVNARIHSKTLVDTEKYQELNREAWKLRSKLTWGKVRSDLDRALADIGACVHRLTAEELTDASCFSLAGRPLVFDYIYEVIEHPMHHWMILYRKAGAEEKAVAMLKRVQEGVSQEGLMKWSLPARKKILKHRQSLEAL